MHNSIVVLVVVSTFERLRLSAFVVLVLVMMRWGKSSTDSENTKKWDSYKESTGSWAKLHTGNIYLMRAVLNWPQLYLNLAETRLTLKTGVKILGGSDQSTSENNYYLFNSRFWHHLGVQILGTKILFSWPIFIFVHVNLKAIKAFDPVNKDLNNTKK